jgi:hypothetical protein
MNLFRITPQKPTLYNNLDLKGQGRIPHFSDPFSVTSVNLYLYARAACVRRESVVSLIYPA